MTTFFSGRPGALTGAVAQPAASSGGPEHAAAEEIFHAAAFSHAGFDVRRGKKISLVDFLTAVLSAPTLLSRRRNMMRMRNPAPANNVLLRTAIDEIQSCLPAHWSTSVAVKTNDASDARLVIKTPAGANAAVAIASKRQLDPSLVPAAADALKTVAADGFLVVSPFLGARTRERLLARGIGYVDLAGNVRLALDRPSILIDRQGQERNPWAKTRDMRSLDGPKASRLIRALCDRSPPFGVRQLAARAETDPGYVSRLLALLRARGAGAPQRARLRRRRSTFPA